MTLSKFFCWGRDFTANIDALLRDTGVPRVDPSDESLSSGERAHARIVAVLVDEWDALDSRQQRALVNVLKTSARASEDAENYSTRRFADGVQE
ncbi:antitoxin [Corynebacterium breve]|uniref:Antitoxin n=1 Tax=Corynebacterium breve TaxID=3049799 RepID=A0ABY8VJK4_9CORY|nr:antitoxin [Corynebacterium breve]WIM67760.1 antitoxin [Corynebacterium breve]